MRPLRLLNALKKHRVQVKNAPRKGLMFMDATLNGKNEKSVIINTYAAHNFISNVEAHRIGSNLRKMLYA